jgi:predicted deacylase
VEVSHTVEAGPIRAEAGEQAFGFLPIATMADGGDVGIPVHIVAGARPGPKLVVMSASHGYETRQISVIQTLVETVDRSALSGALVLVPVANPVAFEMGTRGTWIDSLWGDSGNMNRLWPGRPNGWITERFTYAIATQVFPDATCVIDLHGYTPDLALSYGYLGIGKPGDVDYDVSRAFGNEILVHTTRAEIDEKHQWNTSKNYLRSKGIVAYGCEIGEFYGLEAERSKYPPERLTRSVPEVGVTGVTNIMKYFKMLPGEIRRPTAQIKVEPELNLRPSHGGLLVSETGPHDLGSVLPKGALLGRVISPYSFKVMEEIRAPFDQNLLTATPYKKPFTKVHPGDYAYIVSDLARCDWLPSASA